MTDRELLELAAKAAEIDDAEWSHGDGHIAGCILTARLPGFRCWWNPLTDDGDALRLAVKLRLDVRTPIVDTARIYDWNGLPIMAQMSDGDPYSATRRAIVRAAAEIGKATK